MNKVISFIMGALVMFVIMFSIGMLKDDSIDVSDTTSTSEVVEVQENKDEITKQIAFVNSDIGVGETNVAKSLIENMPLNNDYEAVTTTYSDAKSGIENDEYVAYVMFDSNYTATLLSVATDELPEKAKITVKINSELSDEQFTEVNQLLFADYMYIKDTVNYIYIAYLLDILHDTQDDVSSIIGNEEYMNSIAQAVAGYTTNVANSLADYLKEPPTTEIELNLEGLEGLAEKNINQLSMQAGIDQEQLLTTMTSAQAEFNADISQTQLDSDLTANELELDLEDSGIASNEVVDEQLNNYLETNISNLSSQKEVMDNALTVLNGYLTIVGELPELEDIEVLEVLKAMVNASLQNDPSQLEGVEDSYKFEVINNFVLNYAQWYAGVNGISLEACTPTLEDDEVDDRCMAKFKSAYDLHFDEWKGKEQEIENGYYAITVDTSLITQNITEIIQEGGEVYSLSNSDIDYLNYIMADHSIEENAARTAEYCSDLEESNIVSQLVCGVSTFTEIIASYDTVIADTSELVAEHNSELASEVEAINSDIDSTNQEVNYIITTHETNTVSNIDSNATAINERLTDLQSAVNKAISTVNIGKNMFITGALSTIENSITSINDTIGNVEDSQYEDRQKVSDAASAYNESYAKAADGYTTNISLLSLFANILPSTRNGSDANYYLYDYLVNPLDIILKTRTNDKELSIDPSTDNSETVDPSEPQVEEEKNMYIVIIVALILIAGLGVYMVLKGEEYDD